MSVWPAEPAWSAVGHPLQPPCPVASAPGQAGCGPLSQLMPGLGVHQEPVEVSALEADSADRQPTPPGPMWCPSGLRCLPVACQQAPVGPPAIGPCLEMVWSPSLPCPMGCDFLNQLLALTLDQILRTFLFILEKKKRGLESCPGTNTNPTERASR